MSQDQPTFSFELFPPKTPEGMDKLKVQVERLNAVGPRVFLLHLWGRRLHPGAHLRDRRLAAQPGHRHRPAPRLHRLQPGRGRARSSTTTASQGIRRIVALRGDLPSGMGTGTSGDFRYANELVAFIRAEHGDWFHIEVAAYPEFHPQAANAAKDLENFRRKVEAGADAAITQYFYNADAYFAFVDACTGMGLDLPIVPGIMPITNFTQLARFSDACGAEIPRWIRRRMEGLGDDIEEIRAFGHGSCWTCAGDCSPAGPRGCTSTP